MRAAVLLSAAIVMASCAPSGVTAPTPTAPAESAPTPAPPAATSVASPTAAGIARDDLSARARSLAPAGWRPWPVTASDRFGTPLFVTPDGKGLVWSRGQAGGSTDVLEIATGTNRAFPGGGGTTSQGGWRVAGLARSCSPAPAARDCPSAR